jgi:hypothetical protein
MEIHLPSEGMRMGLLRGRWGRSHHEIFFPSTMSKLKALVTPSRWKKK